MPAVAVPSAVAKSKLTAEAVVPVRVTMKFTVCRPTGMPASRHLSRTFLAKLGKDNWPVACGHDWNSWHYDAACHVPATYVIALADKILPVAWQERFAARVNASRLVRIDSGHQGMNTRPFSLAEILIAEARLGDLTAS